MGELMDILRRSAIASDADQNLPFRALAAAVLIDRCGADPDITYDA
jgi:hypothetical protein